MLKKIVVTSAIAAACASAGPVSHFGKLVSCGKNICGEKTGTSLPIQLKGPSLYWSTGMPAALFSPITVDWFVLNFDIGVIRAPMAIKYYKENSEPISVSDGNSGVTSYGYLSTDATGSYKKQSKALIKSIVDQAIADDIYVIVDWHSHNAHNGETSEAAAFFGEMASEYKNVPNIIWEIYNEPVNASSRDINEYAKTVISAIRNAGNDNIVIIGSSGYSANPGTQASENVGDKNVGYTLHFYAGTGAHDGYRNNVPSSAPTFVTEWGASEASGNGYISDASSWRTWMDNNKISGCMWFAGPANESSAMFPEGATPGTLDNYKSNFSGTNTTAGVFNAFMSTNKWTSFVPADHPMGKTIAASVSEGATKVFSSSDLGISGTISGATVTHGKATFSDDAVTYISDDFGMPESAILKYNVTKNSVTITETILLTIVDRKPILKDTALSVSYKIPTKIALTKIGAQNPISKVLTDMTVASATASSGSIEFQADTLIFTPSGTEGEVVEVTYSAKNKNGTSSATLTLTCENQAPTIYNKTILGNVPNTDPIKIGVKGVRGSDADDDEITFVKYYLAPAYPGTLTINDTKDTLTYTPDGKTTGRITILAVLTDGTLNSKIGTITFLMTGFGTEINVTAPTTIPDYDDPNPEPEQKPNSSSSSGQKVDPPTTGIVAARQAIGFRVSANEIHMNLSKSGPVSVKAFDMQGHVVANIFSDNLAAGERTVHWDASKLSSGTYLLMIQQGSVQKAVKYIKK